MRLINADDLCDKIVKQNCMDCVLEIPCRACEVNDRIIEINNESTIDPVKHGRWMKTGQSFIFPERFRNYSCSVCGYDIDKTEYRYCPNCGAKMDEVGK